MRIIKKENQYIVTAPGGAVLTTDSLVNAALVCRYMGGGSMRPDDQARALRIMAEHDGGEENAC